MADVTAEERRIFASRGWAMPDGSFYIRPDHPEDLANAIRAVGRANATGTTRPSDEAQRNAVRRHIIKRARALNRSNEIPDTWNSDGTLKQGAMDLEDFLTHFGVRGMRWGVRRNRPAPGEPGSNISAEAARAAALQTQVRKHGTSSLSNKDLQELVTRLNLDRQYSNLNPRQISAGHKFANDVLRDSSKQLATAFIVKNAPKGAEFLINKAATSQYLRSPQNRRMTYAMVMNVMKGRG